MADPVSLAINAALIAANMALTASQEFEGPRLEDLKVTLADYGQSMNYAHALARFDGVQCIFAEDLKEVKRTRKTKGGKFGDYSYYGTWAVAVCDHPVEAIRRVWFDRKLIYDPTGAGPVSPIVDLGGGGPAGEAAGEVAAQLALGDLSQYMTIYLGAADQEPDPRMAATIDALHGTGSTPAYRGVTYLMFKDLPLEKIGNRLPTISVEVVAVKTDLFPFVERDVAYASDPRLYLSEDGGRVYFTALDEDDGSLTHLEVWDVRANALMSHAVVEGIQTFSQMGVDDYGRIYFAGADFLSIHVLEPEGGLNKIVGPPTEEVWGPDYAAFNEIDALTVLDNIAYGSSWGTMTDGWRYIYPLDYATRIDTSRFLGEGLSCQLRFYFKDAYGGHWVVGGRGDLPNDVLFIKQLSPGVDQPSTVGVAQVEMPAVNASTVVGAHGFHCSDGLNDYIVVCFGNPSSCVVRLDWANLEIQDQTTDVTAFFSDYHAADVKPGSRYLWNSQYQWDFVTMTKVREVQFGDWDPVYEDQTFAIYDRLGNSLIRGDEDKLTWFYLDRLDSDGVTLASIVEDISARCGLVDGQDFDASDLTQIVQGYSWRQAPAKSILDPLLEAYDSEVRPHDFLLEFLRRGVAVGGAIPVADMGAGGSVRYTVPELAETDLPLSVSFTFSDIDKDLQPNTALSQRPGAATDSRRQASIDGSTLVTDIDTARQMADGYRRRLWIKAQTYELSLTRAYTALEPGDARQLVLDDVTVSAKLVRNEFGANGVLTQTWERYAPSVHNPTALTGAPADGLTPSEVPVFGYTKGVVLDIPLTQDGHDATAPFVYLAAAPYGDLSWPGATFYRSADAGETYDDELGSVSSAERAAIGSTLSALPDALPEVWDRASSVTVQMFSGELTSATEAECENGANLAVIGSELVNFTTATLVAPGNYQLSGFLRGRRGSEWACGQHAAGDRFVLLDALPRATMGADDVDENVYVRPTTVAGPAGFPQLIEPYTGAALKPYAPAHLEVEDDGGDLVATWVRRTRIGGNWSDYQDVPLGEGSEAYIGRILDAGGNIIRTFTGLTSPTLTYTAAQQASDGSPAGVSLSVAQVSASVGNGYFAEAVLP